ncbi:MAG: TonB C-terminal domain-containing protein [Arenicellales bacterium]|nr:TonB C-terminal domain-containing protein [Arenicellales bacterium]
MQGHSRKGANPLRAFVYAIVIHVAFGAMLGVSLWIQPRTIMPVEGKPVQAKAIDLAAIQREKKKKAEAEKKKKLEAEKKKKAEAEKKKKEAERKKQEAEQAQRERDEQEAVSAFGAVAWAIQEEVRINWNPPAGDFEGFSVLFTIRVDREGNVTSVTMVRGSGNARFDESAENAIYKASPLPIPGEPRFYEYLKEFDFKFSP